MGGRARREIRSRVGKEEEWVGEGPVWKGKKEEEKKEEGESEGGEKMRQCWRAGVLLQTK